MVRLGLLLVLIGASVQWAEGQFPAQQLQQQQLSCGSCDAGKVRLPSNGIYCGACVEPATSCAQGYLLVGQQCLPCPCGESDPLKIRTRGCRWDASGNVVCDCNPNYAGSSCQTCSPGCIQRDYFPYDCFKPGDTSICYGNGCQNQNFTAPGPVTGGQPGCPGGNCGPQIQPPRGNPGGPGCPTGNCGGGAQILPIQPGCPGTGGSNCGSVSLCQASQGLQCRQQASYCPNCQCIGPGCPCDTCQFNQQHYSTAINNYGQCPPCQHQHTACPPCNSQCPSCPPATSVCPTGGCGAPSPCQPQPPQNCQCPPPCPSCCNNCGGGPQTPIYVNGTTNYYTNVYNTTVVYVYSNTTCQLGPGTTTEPTVGPGSTTTTTTTKAPPTVPVVETVCEKVCCDPRGTYNFANCAMGRCECSCKANVIGAQCDHCKPGYFGLMEKNRDGCVSCFCSGVSKECTEAVLFKSTIELDFANHGLVVTDRSFYYVDGIRSNDSPKEVVLNYIDAYRQEVLYWKLPDSFIGDRLTSYGCHVHLSRRFITKDDSKSLFGNDIIIIGTYGSSIYWASPETHASRSTSKLTVNLDDKSGWLSYRSGATRVATRNEIMEVLADVKSILIRASMGTPGEMELAALSNVHLCTASSKQPGGVKPAITSLVEDCVCPAGYQGLSCQSCSPGYYRDNTDSSKGVFGTCKKCPCNDHADGCYLENGKVLCQCKDGYSGPDCKSCEPLTLHMDPIKCRDCHNTLTTFNCSFSGGRDYKIDITTVPDWSQINKATFANKKEVVFPGEQLGSTRTVTIPLLTTLKYVECKVKHLISGEVVMMAKSKVETDNCEPAPPMLGFSVDLRTSSEFECLEANGTVEFSCSSSTSADDTKVEWFREGGRPLPTSARVIGQTIRFDNAQPSDSGGYVCTLRGHNLNSIYTKTVVLKVKECIKTVGGVPVATSTSTTQKPEESDETAKSQEDGTGEDADGNKSQENKSEEKPKDSFEDSFEEPFVPTTTTTERPWTPVDYVDSNEQRDEAKKKAKVAPAAPSSEDKDEFDFDFPDDAPAASAAAPSGNVVVQTQVLEVNPPTGINVTPWILKVNAGQKAEFQCSASGDNVKVMWRVDNGSDEVLESKDGLLAFASAKESDEGNYVCIAYNSIDKVTAKVSLVVDPPSFKLSIKTNSKANESDADSQLVLDCEPNEEVYKRQWRKDGGELPSTAVQHTNGSLVIEKLEKEHVGVYVCDGVSVLGTTAEARVEVKLKETNPLSAPVVKLSHKSPYRIQPGQSFRIHCSSRGDPTPQIIWSRRMLNEDGPFESILREDDSSKSYYEFTNIQAEDEGHYTCTAKNEAGEDHKTVLIVVDEQAAKQCQEDEFRCRNGQQCIPKSLRCNGAHDCSDGSDENATACARLKRLHD